MVKTLNTCVLDDRPSRQSREYDFSFSLFSNVNLALPLEIFSFQKHKLILQK